MRAESTLEPTRSENTAAASLGEAGTVANALNQPIDGVWCERAAPLGREDEATILELPAECPDLVAPQRMDARLAILDAADMQRGRAAEFTCDHSRSQISAARNPCRKATRIRVASRWP